MTSQRSVLRHMIGLALRADRRRAIAIVVLVIAGAGVTAAVGASQRWLIDSAGMGTLSGVLAATALGVLAHTMSAAGHRVQHNMRSDLTVRVDVQVNREILTATSTIPGIAHLERPEYLDRLTRLRRSTPELTGAGWAVAETGAALVSLCLVLWLLGTVHPILVTTALLAAPPLYFANRGRKVIQRVADETAELERVETELHQMFTDPDAAKDVKASGSGDWLSAHADDLWGQVLHRRARAHIHASVLQLAGWASYALGFVAALAIVTQLAIDGRATIGDTVMVITLASQLLFTVNWTVEGITRLGAAGHVIGHYQWLMDYGESQRSTGHAHPPERFRDGITLRGVSFAYPGTDRDVLTNLDIDLPAGHTVALVGINGAGKTSLVKLLTGLYRPTHGTISIDGTAMSDLDPAAWQERVTGTFQDFMKFQFRVRETVGVGHLPHIDDTDAVHRAVADGGASTIVASLAGGLETQLGRTFDGTELSQGQWQRLALARGHMRRDPLLLVLDEPTAALDPQAEHDLYERFMTQTRSAAARTGSIALLVSHRFSTVRMADLIIVLHHGRVTETGTHDELIAANGTYAEHYRVQADGYSTSPRDAGLPD